MFAGQTLRDAPAPINQWGFAIASIPLGMTAGYVLLGRPQERRRLVMPIAVFALAALAALLWIEDAACAEALRRFVVIR